MNDNQSPELQDYCVMMIPHDAEPYVAVWQLPKRESLMFHAALRLAVSQVTGDPVERVRVFADFYGGKKYSYLDMFVNEEGGIEPDPLPVNVAATAIYRFNVLFHEPGKVEAEDMPVIFGHAVLFEKRVWF